MTFKVKGIKGEHQVCKVTPVRPDGWPGSRGVAKYVDVKQNGIGRVGGETVWVWKCRIFWVESRKIPIENEM